MAGITAIAWRDLDGSVHQVAFTVDIDMSGFATKAESQAVDVKATNALSLAQKALSTEDGGRVWGDLAVDGEVTARYGIDSGGDIVISDEGASLTFADGSSIHEYNNGEVIAMTLTSQRLRFATPAGDPVPSTYPLPPEWGGTGKTGALTAADIAAGRFLGVVQACDGALGTSQIRNIKAGSAAPGPLAQGEIYLQFES